MVSFPKVYQSFLLEIISTLLFDSDVKELKWKKVKSAQYRFAALKIIDFIVKEAIQNHIRVDVIVWDTQDSRHKLVSRDDHTNLQRMYFQLFKNVLHKRWSRNSTWQLYPDQNSIINWKDLHHKLDQVIKYKEIEYKESNLMDNRFSFDIEEINSIMSNLIYGLSVIEISETDSTTSPFVQVADLFVGMGVFSFQQHETFLSWELTHSNQMTLGLFDKRDTFTSKEDEHCFVLHHFEKLCKHHRLQVSIHTGNGLITKNPSKPINYWLYIPQGSYDKAPIRNDEVLK